MPRNIVTNFLFATPDEIAAELGRRLQVARLSQGLQQGDLASMAGVSRAAISSLENRGKSTLETFLRVVSSLGLTQELESLFSAKPVSIAQMEAASQQVQRAPRRRHKREEGAAAQTPATRRPPNR